jgi:hypothetical protein
VEKNKNGGLDVKQVLKDFRDYEDSEDRRKGTFKIGVPFEQAVKKITKAKPEPKATKKSRKPK